MTSPDMSRWPEPGSPYWIRPTPSGAITEPYPPGRRPGQNPWDRSPHHRPQHWEGGPFGTWPGTIYNDDGTMDNWEGGPSGGVTDNQVGNNESIIRSSVNKPRVTSQTFR